MPTDETLARGGEPQRFVAVDRFENIAEAPLDGPFLAVGNRLSDGDVCRNSAGLLIDMRPRNRILGFDPGTGLVRCEAGVTLSQIVHKAAAQHFFPPVMTEHGLATVGGAIAFNVFGRNEAARGRFGDHVRSLQLMRSTGAVLTCSRNENADLFAATVGGLGLTGLVLSAELALMKVPSAHLQRHAWRFDRLADGLRLQQEMRASHEYLWAVLDPTAGGDRAGRGVLFAADHADAGSELPDLPQRRTIPLPFHLPFQRIGRLPLRAAYALALLRVGGREAAKTMPWWDFFWPAGRLRYKGGALAPLGLRRFRAFTAGDQAGHLYRQLDDAARQAGHLSLLTELHGLGKDGQAPQHALSFVFADRGAATDRLIGRLQAVTVEVGGGLFPADRAAPPQNGLNSAGARLQSLEIWRDSRFSSDFWRNMRG